MLHRQYLSANISEICQYIRLEEYGVAGTVALARGASFLCERMISSDEVNFLVYRYLQESGA